MTTWDWQVFCKNTVDGEVIPRCFGEGGDITYLDGDTDKFQPSVVVHPQAVEVTEAKLRELPLLQILREAGEVITAGEQLISAVGAGPAIAAQLQLEPRAPVLRH